MYKLILDDVMNVDIPKCRLLLTDIPYGKVSRESGGLRNLNKGDADIETFNVTEFLNHIYDSADVFVIFCGNEQYSTIYDFFNIKSQLKQGTVRQIIWSKTNPSPMNSQYVLLNGTENAVWFKKKGTGKLRTHYIHNVYSAPTGSSKYHPTEKNHILLKKIILDHTDEGDLVVDTCAGSGSTGIVANQLNRKFIGIEINKKYYDIANKRLHLNRGGHKGLMAG